MFSRRAHVDAAVAGINHNERLLRNVASGRALRDWRRRRRRGLFSYGARVFRRGFHEFSGVHRREVDFQPRALRARNALRAQDLGRTGEFDHDPGAARREFPETV